MGDTRDLMINGLGEWVGKAARSVQYALRFSIDLSARDLERLLGTGMPWVLEWRGFTLRFDRPRLAIEQASDQLRLRLAVVLSLPIGRPAHGSVELQGRLRYDAEAGQLYLDAAECSDLTLAGYRRLWLPLRLSLAPLLRPWLARRPVFEWRSDSRTHALAKGTLAALEVRKGVVRLHFRSGKGGADS